jgi:hypothetical protein
MRPQCDNQARCHPHNKAIAHSAMSTRRFPIFPVGCCLLYAVLEALCSAVSRGRPLSTRKTRRLIKK